MKLTIADEVRGLRLAVVEAHGISIRSDDDAWRDELRRRVQQVQQQGPAGDQPRRDAVRKLLRFGGFKPSGRSKPAQEYLLRTVTDTNALPEINNAVDLINIHSLASGLPISLLASDRLSDAVQIRYGRANDSFVFNASGQQLSLEGLLCICREQDADSVPLGTPVKDSMQGKVTEQDRDVVAFVYAPSFAVEQDELQRVADALAADWRQWCSAESCEVRVITSPE